MSKFVPIKECFVPVVRGLDMYIEKKELCTARNKIGKEIVMTDGRVVKVDRLYFREKTHGN